MVAGDNTRVVGLPHGKGVPAAMRTFEQVLRVYRRLPPIVIDGAIAAAIVLIEGVEILGPNEPNASQIGLLAVGAIGVTLRRKNVWVAFSIVQLAAVVGLLTDSLFINSHGGQLEEFVVLFTVSERRTTRASIGA